MLKTKNTIITTSLVLCFALPIMVTADSQINDSQKQTVTITKAITSMPLAFTANQGQWDEKVKFRANAGGATMWFTSGGAYYQFTRPVSTDMPPDSPVDPINERFLTEPELYESMVITASFVGANPGPQMVGANMIDYKCNYFIGNDPDKWCKDVPNYNAIVYQDIYTGIDLKYYGNGTHMEYDFVVSPGADPSQILVQYNGARSVTINRDHELVVETEWGEVVERRPVVYQLHDGVRMPIEAEYLLAGDNSFGFSLGKDYDPARALIIDPVLSYSTYIGGYHHDYGLGIAVDDSGYAYIGGSTYSLDFPTEGAFQLYPGMSSAFVTKLNRTGSALVYSTYLGGGLHFSFFEHIAVDDSGSAYVVGTTYATDFPTLNAYEDTLHGAQDAFVTKLNSSGSDLVYSTFLGGGDNDCGVGITVDDSGSAYVTGYTKSSDFPTLAASQYSLQGISDAFVTKLNAAGNALVYSTYLGGNDDDAGVAISVDDLGNAYVIGRTESSDFPTEGEYQSYQGGKDVFVTKLNGTGNTLVYSTFLGGEGGDFGACIAVDPYGSAYITGGTASSNYPTAGAYQADQDTTDAFVTKLNAAGNALVYSTYLGGSESDVATAIALDGSGNAYVTGYTESYDFPTEEECQTHQGDNDAFVTKLNGSGNALVYSTYLGGSESDVASAIALDGSGNAYVTGYTESIDFPTLNAYEYTLHGEQDAFVAKFIDASDVDDDGVPDGADNCPDDANSGQLDSDEDTVGDVCDNCPTIANSGQADSNGDDIGDACTFESSTPAGTSVFVDLGSKANLDIENVITGGTTIMTITSSGPGGNPYEVVPSDPAEYYNITTTAVYDGAIEVCVEFDDTELSAENEVLLSLYHWDGIEWTIITSSLDTATNVICGLTDQLSPFAVGLPYSSCCGIYTGGITGNANCSEDGKLTLSDITRLIDRVYVSKEGLCCEPNGNTNADEECKITLSDITVLIDAVYISKTPPAACMPGCE